MDAFIHFDNDALHGKCLNGDVVNQIIENINILSTQAAMKKVLNHK